MKLYPLEVGGQEYKVAVADNDQLRSKGLSGLKRLGKAKGMLFVFSKPVRMRMIMTDMNFGLDFIFLDSEWKTIHTGSLEQDDTEGIYPPVECTMVLELPRGSKKGKVKPGEELSEALEGAIEKFEAGGKFELVGEKVYKIKEDDVKADPKMLQILNNNGEVVANIGSGSRIFSRPHTREMIAKFKKGDKIGLAKAVMAILEIQDNQEPDYVKK